MKLPTKHLRDSNVVQNKSCNESIGKFYTELMEQVLQLLMSPTWLTFHSCSARDIQKFQTKQTGLHVHTKLKLRTLMPPTLTINVTRDSYMTTGYLGALAQQL